MNFTIARDVFSAFACQGFGHDDANVTTTGEVDGDALARVGDWRDTIPLYGNVAYVVRFVSPFAGLMMVHCHIQKHSEYGMMALAEVAG